MDLPKRYNPKEVEPRLQKFWEDQKIYSYDPNSDKPSFSVDTPPPYVSSDHLHLGHAMSYSQAEFIVRYKRMRGYNIFYPMGFDDNGLPTERYVEKKYKVDKSKISRQDFINLCLKETKVGAQIYRDLWGAMGISVDWSLSYSTIDDRSRRTAQRSFIDLVEKRLIEKRDEPILWCYHCSTSVAQADLDTMEIASKLNDIAFIGDDGRKELIISTTRPELIPACVSIYANPDDERYASLVGTKVRVPLFDYAVEVRTHPDVDLTFGTGLMMVCSWGDVDDVAKWKDHNLNTRHIFDERGRLNNLAGPLKGLSVEKARQEILKALGEKGFLKASKTIAHNVGVHDRCGTPIEFNHSPQWFIRVMDYKDEFLRRGEELNWYPDLMKARYDDWVKGLRWDWCISRQRYYGVPFPVWYCEKCQSPWFPSIEQLPVEPTVDPVPEGARCACGGESFVGEGDVMDTWMTSSLTPLINARWTYDDNSLVQKIYPMSIRVQAFEIIRTWLFYTLLKSHFHTNSLPWKDVMISGWGLDAEGKKMSKQLGNFIDPMTVIKKYSADALRYWSAGSTLGNNLRYNEQDVVDGNRLMTKLWNATRFVSTYLFDENGKPLPLYRGDPSLSDRWVASRFWSAVKSATLYLDKYEYSHAMDVSERFFFSDFCDNYLEVIKQRLWNSDQFPAGQVEAARHTIYSVLLGVIKLLAPFIPYITEELYQKVFRPFGGPVSIHISTWPEYDESMFDAEAEAAGQLLVDVLTGVRRWKTGQKVHMNFPLSQMVITVSGEEKARLESIADDLRAAAHAASLEFGEGGEIPTETGNISLKLTLDEKTPKS